MTGDVDIAFTRQFEALLKSPEGQVGATWKTLLFVHPNELYGRPAALFREYLYINSKNDTSDQSSGPKIAPTTSMPDATAVFLG